MFCRYLLCGWPLSRSGTGCGDSKACPQVGVASSWARGPATREAGGPEDGGLGGGVGLGVLGSLGGL